MTWDFLVPVFVGNHTHMNLEIKEEANLPPRKFRGMISHR